MTITQRQPASDGHQQQQRYHQNRHPPGGDHRRHAQEQRAEFECQPGFVDPLRWFRRERHGRILHRRRLDRENFPRQSFSRLAQKPLIRQDCPFSAAQMSAMNDITEIKQSIRRLMVENLMLQLQPEEIGDAQPLFGPGSVGLDSVDALQLVVALDKVFGLKIGDPEAAKQILQNVNSIAEAVRKHQAEIKS